MLSTAPEQWHLMGEGDKSADYLVDPETGKSIGYDELLRKRSDRLHQPQMETFRRQWSACQDALEILGRTLREIRPDVLVVVSDDQEEMLFDDCMPALQIYCGEKIRLIPRFVPPAAPEVVKSWVWGYGDVEMDLPIDAPLAEHLIEHLTEQEFDVGYAKYPKDGDVYGGRVGPNSELTRPRITPPRRQGLGHGWTFIVKRLLNNIPLPMVPVMLNTCYPPNAPTPRRCFRLGQALHKAIDAWQEDTRVCVMASGGLSHFITDEHVDRLAIRGMMQKDAETLSSLPRHQLLSASSEIKNWIACAGACEHLTAEVVDYVPVYRTPAGTGGGWAFMRWQ